ncbi:MAG: VCBS repeat-containing protein [Kiritimatiellae bacterium]|nr:VCBS repeat-containing protein [Kiritimatiellia bacterium]
MSIVALTARLFTHMPRRKAVILPLFAAALFAVRPLAADEAALLRQLAEGTPAEKDSARQTLLVSATAAAIPTLTAQLARPETFDSACLLLEALGLPEADAALRAALTTLDGRELAGVIAALTRRADTAAETAILALVDRPQPVRSAALAYLGKLATPRALAALAAAPQDAITADAMLVAAETLLARGDEKQALALYARVSDDTRLADHIRLAAFCARVTADPDRAHTLLPAALNHASAVWRGTAARLTAQLPDKLLKRRGEDLMKALEPQGRLAVVQALVHAKKRAGAPLVRAALKDGLDAPSRLAAAAGLGDIGDADDADALIALLGQTDDALADAARMSLIKLDDPKTDARIAKALARRPANDAALTRLLGVAAFRKTPRAAPAIAEHLAATAPTVRTAAFQALTELATDKQIPALVAAFCKAVDPQERRAAEKALMACARREPDATTAAILPLFAGADAERRSSLLQATGLAGTPAGLELIQRAVDDSERAVADDAVRVLANWKEKTAAPKLLQLAKTYPNTSLRVIALRGYIRLIDQEQDQAGRATMLREASALATRTQEKALVAGAWRTVPTPEAVAALTPMLDDPALKTEALKSLKVIALHTPVDVPDKAPGSLLTPLTFVPRRIGTYRSEACCVADFNGDGKLDIAAGPYLYLAPDWKAVRIRTVSSNVGEDGKGYADDFCNLVVDVNKDGKPDILAACWFSKTSYWYENTLGSSKELWPEHVIDPLGNHETGTLVDIDGDGKALEFLPDTGVTVWYEPGVLTNGQPGYVRHTISMDKSPFGTGVGDINGDGRPDVIRPNVWYEAPKDIRKDTWKKHPIALGGKDGKVEHTANIIVFDVNKDGLNDLITSVAHKYGIFWYEQQRDASGTISWRQHLIDDTWTQPHYLAFADIDNDGNKEVIVGKRFMAHNGGDPDAFGKLCVFYYRFTPGPNPVFRKHVVTYDEGVSAGLNIVPVDIDGDGDIDLITTGKWGGPVIYENRMTEWVSDDERRAALGVKPTVPEPLPVDNLALASRGAKASSDSELPGNTGCTARLNDGKRSTHSDFPATRWHSALTPMPHWAEIKLAKPAAVRRVIAHFADPNGYATAFEIQVKKGDAYTTVYKTDKNRDGKSVNVTFDPVQTDIVRFVFSANANPAYPNAAQLSELEVYAE